MDKRKLIEFLRETSTITDAKRKVEHYKFLQNILINAKMSIERFRKEDNEVDRYMTKLEKEIEDMKNERTEAIVKMIYANKDKMKCYQ